MTSIKGYTDLLKMVGPLNTQQEQFVQTIRSNVDRMAVLVSDLADISRIETGRLKIEITLVNLSDVVQESLDGLKRQIEQKQQAVSLQLPAGLPPVRADKARLVQVLSNLVNNAHKYSPPGSAITLRAALDDLAPNEGRAVRVDVIDTGFGIAAADQANLFTQFFRSEDPNIREQSGWGLGLHITKRVVEMMGGHITVQSEPGQGSTFSFTVPA